MQHGKKTSWWTIVFSLHQLCIFLVQPEIQRLLANVHRPIWVGGKDEAVRGVKDELYLVQQKSKWEELNNMQLMDVSREIVAGCSQWKHAEEVKNHQRAHQLFAELSPTFQRCCSLPQTILPNAVLDHLGGLPSPTCPQYHALQETAWKPPLAWWEKCWGSQTTPPHCSLNWKRELKFYP